MAQVLVAQAIQFLMNSPMIYTSIKVGVLAMANRGPNTGGSQFLLPWDLRIG